MKNMANIRVRQRAQVHVQGMTTKIANEDVGILFMVEVLTDNV